MSNRVRLRNRASWRSENFVHRWILVVFAPGRIQLMKISWIIDMDLIWAHSYSRACHLRVQSPEVELEEAAKKIAITNQERITLTVFRIFVHPFKDKQSLTLFAW